MSFGRVLDRMAWLTARGRPFPRRQLFLLSHLRSHSSVLSHVVGSHPQIDGTEETHTRYRTRLDLIRLRRRVRKHTGTPLSGDYVFDEILHEYPLARGVLASEHTRGIILVRRPRETVRGILESGLNGSPVAWHRDFELVARYYETRLSGLLRLSEALRGRVVFLEAESLLSHPREVLDQLGAFLELRTRLQPEDRHCTPSDGQRTGDSRRTAVSLPRQLCSRLQNAYDFWCAAIRQSCPVIEVSEVNMPQDDVSAR
jgi:hypothetical protein